MSNFLSAPRRKIWIASFALMVLSNGTSYAQNFSVLVANPDPLGLGNFVPELATSDLGLNGNLKGDFAYGLGLQSVYSSNFFQEEDDGEGELSSFLSPWLRYSSDPEGGAIVSLSGNYRPSGRFYIENDELNGWDQSGDLNLVILGAVTQVDVFGSYVQTSGTDLLTGDFLYSTVKTGGIRANRQLASRTSLDASWTYAKSDFDSSDVVGAEVYTTSLGFFWLSTERLSFGPTLQYTVSKSENIGTRKAWSLMASARYRMGEKIFLSAGIGPEYATFSDDESATNVSLNFSGNYIIDELWSCTGSIVTAVVPSNSQQDTLINNWTVSASVNRKLVRGILSGGLDCNFSGDSTVGSIDDIENKQQNWASYIQYQRAIFSDRIGFNSEFRYVLNTGSSDWSEVQLSAGLSVAF